MMYSSVIEALALNAADNPERLCLADSKKALTYGDVWGYTCALSEKLKDMGVSKKDSVIVECSQNADYMIFEFAIQLLGAVFVPVEKNAARGRISEIAGDTDAVLFASGNAPDELSIKYLDTDCVTELQKIHKSPGDVDFPKKEDVSEILFSTGTTGKSKGIVLTHGNDIAIAENVCTGVRMKPENVELIPMPLSHSHGLRRTYANMCNGSSVVIADGIMLMKKIYQMMDDYHVTSMDLSPSMLTIIFKLSKDRLGDYAGTMDYIQLGSAPLPEVDKLHLAELLPDTRLYNFYGSTEAGCSCLLDFNEVEGKPGCIGKPAVNARFIVVDENRNEIKSSPENTGFLASSGAINMKEYFNAPELTKEAMPDGDYIYTKDVGYIDENGLVYMLGRKDDVINYGGVKISPEELESIIVKHEWIKDCALIPVDDPVTGQAPKLFIELEPETEESFSLKEFKKFLAEEIDANKQPKLIEKTEKIPRTFNGKIIRKDLAE